MSISQPLNIPFGKHIIGDEHPVFVIAEIGINHEGDVDLACEMVEQAAQAGADAIKLQTADPDENYAPETESYALYAKAFIGPEETAKVFALARNLGVEPFTTTGLWTFDWIEKLKPAGYKISSGTLTHIPLIQKVSKSGRPILMSTGIATHEEIDEALSQARASGAEHIGLMQCTSLYPCPDDKIDLASIAWLKKTYKCPVGFSDHTKDSETAGFAVSAGARVIEKHFSLTPERNTYDHHLSLGPNEFRDMVNGIRRAETLLGDGDKPLRAVETAQRMRRCLVIMRDLSCGHIIAPDDIGFMRANDTEDAYLPIDYERIVGSRLTQDLQRYSVLTPKSIELK